MDERLEKALDTANLMTSISNQKKIFFEEFQQNTIFYQNGGIFTLNRELINFVKTIIDLGYDAEYVLIDNNNNPIQISNLKDFFNTILDKYTSALNEYYSKSHQVKTRSIDKLTSI